MKRRLFPLILLAVLFVASGVQAQTLYLHGGADFPSSSTFDDTHLSGINASIGVGVPLSSQFEILLRGSYDRFGADLAESKTFSSYSMAGLLKWNALLTSRLRPYALMGAGNFVEVEGPFEFGLGLSFGAGVGVRTSPRVSLLIEPNYVLVFTEGENRTYVPVRLGMAYSLR